MNSCPPQNNNEGKKVKYLIILNNHKAHPEGLILKYTGIIMLYRMREKQLQPTYIFNHLPT